MVGDIGDVASVVTPGGIYIPQSGKEVVREAVVVAAGPGGRSANGEVIPMSVAAGDVVVLPDFGGTTVKFDNEEFVIFRDSELLGKLENQN
ncbi:chaperonin GroS [Fonticula alba]|uniref:Chaperonin GroS n=1 Tax=Fonticula alba TaxID=691883 RepID=A0A058ZGZ6_FONAL|nr:chaperonin GroS [Fonticula alba]KCV72757.1 chaperonin GroS [Fonticula alba]|eukprot:XP_009492458.1 chaperonin GroS [Fonticula alba]